MLLTAVAPIAWGTTYLVTTEFLPAGHPLFAGLLRALPAGLLAVAIGRTLPRGDWWLKSAVLGVLNIGAFFPLLFLAAERLPGGAAAAVAGVQPLVIIALGAAILRERVRAVSVITALAGLVGVALIVLGPAARLDPLGVLAALGGVSATAAGIVLTKRWGRPADVSPIAYAGWQLTAGGLFLLPLVLLAEPAPTHLDGAAILGYVWLGTVGGLIAYALWFSGIQRLPVFVPGLLVLLSPVVATLLGALVAGESFTVVQAVGLVIVAGALAAGPIIAMTGLGSATRRRSAPVPTP